LPEQTVRYAYDLSGRRTQLQVSENQSIHYRYGAKGQLISLTDWDQQTSHFEYDGVGRQRQTVRQNGLRTSYRHTPAGHLERIAHQIGNKIIGQFRYQLDAAGNRTSANERLAEPSVILATYDKDYAGIAYTGLWDDVDEAKQSQQFSARLNLMFTGQEAQLTMTTGPDHSIFDVYIGGSLWQSFDGYAESPGEQIILIYLQQQGTFPLEIRNRAARNLRSSGYVIGFRQMQIIETAYIQRQIDYIYDKLSRLTEADYGDTQYTYAYDLAGNLTNMNGVTRTYNAANQMVHDGTNALTYDNNGNMISDGVNNYTWDRANRLVSMGGHIYAYNGDGNRVRQTVDSLVKDYLLDLQPTLALVLGDSAGNRYVHAPRGIHAVNEGAGWYYPLTDALGSVRGYVDASNAVLSNIHYTEYGVPDAPITGFAFTGEQRDSNALQYHRARYYAPSLGIFPSLDPWEGLFDRPMSLNGYSWVEGNVVNRVDPSGEFTQLNKLLSSNNIIVSSSILNKGLCLQNTENVAQLLASSIIMKYDSIENIRSGIQTRSINEVNHLQVLMRLEQALDTIDSELKKIGRNLDSLITRTPLDITLDFEGSISGSFQGRVIRDQGSGRVSLGNNIFTEYIVHEWGHVIDRDFNFYQHSKNMASQKITTTLSLPKTAFITAASFTQPNSPATTPIYMEIPITGIQGCNPYVEDPITYNYGGISVTVGKRILSGYPSGSMDYQRCKIGYGDMGNPDLDLEEDWADMFMNWVYDNRSDSDRGAAGFHTVSHPLIPFAIARRNWINQYMGSI
jgi:RHS repeat-associated protein